MRPAVVISIALSIALFCTCSLFLFFHVSPREPHCDIDSKAYLERGMLFAQTNRFVTDNNPEQPYYALGYALCIGVLYKLLGQSKGIVIVFQLALTLLSLLLIMRVTRRLFGGRAAVVAAVLFACNLGYLTFTQFILTEITLSFLLLLFFERLVYAHPVQAALALGASIIVKPAAILFIVPLSVLLFVALPGSGMRRLTTVVLCAVCFYVPVLGYMTYNYYAFSNFCVSTLGRVNLYYWHLPNVLASYHHSSADDERRALQALPEAEVAQRIAAELTQRPWLFVRVWLLNVAKTWLGLYTTNLKVLVEPAVHGGDVSFFKTTGSIWCKVWQYISSGATHWWVIAIGVLEALWTMLRLVLVACGFVRLLQQRQFFFAMLCILFLGYFSLITGHDGCARFRMMFEFLLIVLAAGGIERLFTRKAF